jgi:hypothetical protein
MGERSRKGFENRRKRPRNRRIRIVPQKGPRILSRRRKLILFSN